MRQILKGKCLIIFFPIISHHLEKLSMKASHKHSIQLFWEFKFSSLQWYNFNIFKLKSNFFFKGWNFHYIQESTQLLGYLSIPLLIYHLEFITRSLVGKISLQQYSKMNIHAWIKWHWLHRNWVTPLCLFVHLKNRDFIYPSSNSNNFDI